MARKKTKTSKYASIAILILLAFMIGYNIRQSRQNYEEEKKKISFGRKIVAPEE